MNKTIENWTELQFENVNLGDKRLNKRTQIIAGNMIKKPSASINSQSENWSQSKGAYRFFDSNKVSFQELIRPHTKLVTNEANSLDLVLAIQDTCYIGYGHHPSVKGLGNIGPEKTKGVILHNTLAVNPSSNHAKVIGILNQHIHNRTDDKDEEWKETNLWIEASKKINIDTKQTNVVEVMDREGAVHEIMKNCLELNHNFLIRSKSNRIVRTPFKHQLYEVASKIKSAGYIELKIPKKKGQVKRKAKLEIKFMSVQIPGPVGNKGDTISCNLVQALEVNPPKDQEALSWYLLTSVDVNSFEDALMIIKWYRHRWIIEEYHKCIKTGCNVESKQLKDAFRIENFLGIANIIAVKILQIRDLVRVMPDEPAKIFFNSLSIKMLQRYHKDTRKELTVKQYYVLLAKMGGYLNRKSDGDPGWQTLWQGQQQLYWMLKGYQTMSGIQA